MGKRRIYTGTVVSDKMQKTRIVRTVRMGKHAKYGKIMKIFNKFKAHDEKNLSKAGDVVRIEETRPISKDKRFRVIEIIKKAELPELELNDSPEALQAVGKPKSTGEKES